MKIRLSANMLRQLKVGDSFIHTLTKSDVGELTRRAGLKVTTKKVKVIIDDDMHLMSIVTIEGIKNRAQHRKFMNPWGKPSKRR